ncbi:hypothetical protein [Flavobacterium acetivorans]|uniref:hypothetical protein n=1 Tax=Flavobacterium acetivorans TaxID=2893883 RepID=UPI001E652F9E|nr:hypothetical protein [Flavobacterium sp. F-29]UFH34517.1 hypothetical protein LNP19_10480 [Flavobacterium sp. F-29]
MIVNFENNIKMNRMDIKRNGTDVWKVGTYYQDCDMKPLDTYQQYVHHTYKYICNNASVD